MQGVHAGHVIQFSLCCLFNLTPKTPFLLFQLHTNPITMQINLYKTCQLSSFVLFGSDLPKFWVLFTFLHI